MNQLGEDELQLLAKKWALPILVALSDGLIRPVQISDAIAGMSDKARHETLTRLCEGGLITRRRAGDNPPVTEYHLTAAGHATLAAARLFTTLQPARDADPDPADTAADASYRARVTDCAEPPQNGQQQIDATVPRTARIYDYLLGGKDNFAVDRDAADEMVQRFPGIQDSARANRAFMVRAVRYLASHGIRQYFDLGTGIPTSPNVHEIAREYEPEARVVYIDNDPIVVAHNRGLRATRDGVVAVDLDVRNLDDIRSLDGVRDTIDFTQPVAVLAISILHFFDDAVARAIVRDMRSLMAPGDYLVLSTGWNDGITETDQAGLDSIYRKTGSRAISRTRDEIAEYFHGLDLVPPGLAPINQWQADDPDLHNKLLGGVGRQPDDLETR